ncbi:endodeoxyribonuclease [Teratosphaeriaceae sp. CCFEE 6253]|nr:endodeoxyribonuclease [Teratosphaeriaceae sp. CCFEE 6253]
MDDFEDLLSGEAWLFGCSQESLSTASADLDFCESEEEVLDGESEVHHERGWAADVEDDAHARVLGTSSTAASTPWPPFIAQATDPPPSTHESPARCSTGTCDVDTQMASAPDEDAVPARQPPPVLARIEAIFQQMADDMVNHRPEIALALHVRPRNPVRGVDVGSKAAASERKVKRLSFPGKTAKEAWRFTVVLRILELMHGALRTGVTISKRDIYYRDPALFGSQTHVDRCVDDIAYTFSVPRFALNVTAVAKGLLVGALSICRRDGSITNAVADRDGMLVPNLKDILSIDLTAVKWIIVVEKEASFRSIAASTFWARLSSEGVLLTGKGYPDLATRALLRYLCTPSPQNGFAAPACYALVDYDPDGLAIMSVYRHGSMALAHESAELCVPRLRWLGLRGEDMVLGAAGTYGSQGLLTLTGRDRGKARKMLERTEGGEGGEERRALQVMIMLNVKAELQLLDAVPGGMTDLLERELGGFMD